MKRVLSFDASSTTIGVCVLSYDDDTISLDYIDYYKPPKKGNIFERLAQVRQYIESKIDEFDPDDVSIEDIVLFMKGNSTAKTITTLAVLNRTVGLAIFNKMDKPPYLYNVMRIRHAIKEDKALPSKQDIPELVAKILSIDFPYILNKKGNLAEENEDMADAVACGLCHAYMDRAGKADQLQITKKKKKKRKKKITQT